MKEVVVTAAGVLSPIGNSVEDFQAGLFEGQSGISHLKEEFLGADFPVPFFAATQAIRAPGALSQSPAKSSMYAAATENLLMQIDRDLPGRLGLDAVISGHRDPSEFHVALAALGRQRFDNGDLDELVRESPLETAGDFLLQRDIVVREDRKIWLSNACNTGNAVLGMALHKIRAGQWRRALVFNIELDPNLLHLLGFFILGALNTEDRAPDGASRPFSDSRAGFVKAAGATVFLLEERALAENRGARILGKLRGYASASDAYSLVESRPDTTGLVRSMTNAIRDARLSPDQIDFVSAHATSTRRGDDLELGAIEKVFSHRPQKILVTALKSQVGHATFASGGLEALAALIELREQRVARILNLERAQERPLVSFARGGSREAKLTHALCNNIGFGGQSSSLVLERYEGLRTVDS